MLCILVFLAVPPYHPTAHRCKAFDISIEEWESPDCDADPQHWCKCRGCFHVSRPCCQTCWKRQTRNLTGPVCTRIKLTLLVEDWKVLVYHTTECGWDKTCVDQAIYGYDVTQWISCWSTLATGNRVFLERPTYPLAVWFLAVITVLTWLLFVSACIRFCC